MQPQRLKVLFIHCAYQVRGGEDTVVDEEMTLLQEAGVTVDLLLFRNEGKALFNVMQLPFNFSAYRETQKKLATFRPHVVHLHNWHFAASPSVLYAVKRSGIPLVCTLHNFRLLCPSATLFHNEKLFLNSLHEWFPLTAVKKGVYKNSRLLTLWLALSMQAHRLLGTWKIPARFILLSQHAKNILLQANTGIAENQMVIKPNFCCTANATTATRTKAFVFVGRLSPEKGLPLLLRVFAGSPFSLIIAGDGPLKEEVEAYANMHPNIVYAGRLSKSGVQALLQQASALVFPSVWFEGMPLTIIEAFACGTPVIASNLGAMAFMINNNSNGLLFDAGSELALLQALQQWHHLPAVAKERFSEKAAATYEQLYTPHINLHQLLAVYTAVKEMPEPAMLPGQRIAGASITEGQTG